MRWRGLDIIDARRDPLPATPESLAIGARVYHWHVVNFIKTFTPVDR